MANQAGQVYVCEICGIKVKMLVAGKGVLICCGQPMKLTDEKQDPESFWGRRGAQILRIFYRKIINLRRSAKICVLSSLEAGLIKGVPFPP